MKMVIRTGTVNVRIQFISLGMNKFLKYSDLQETVLNELTRRQELLIDRSKS